MNTTINTFDLEILTKKFQDYSEQHKHNHKDAKNAEILMMVYPHLKDKINGKQVPVRYVIQEILTKAARKNVSSKENLPVGYFSASGFNGSTCDINVTNHSGLIIIDIDKKDNLNTDFSDLKKFLQEDLYTFACFSSPSGGLKLIVNTNIRSVEHHDAYYESIRKYLLKSFPQIQKIDGSGSNVARACYLPYDDSAYFNPNSTQYLLSQEQIEEILADIHLYKHKSYLRKPIANLEHLSSEEHYDNIINLIKNKTTVGLAISDSNIENRTSMGQRDAINNRTSMGHKAIENANNNDNKTSMGQGDAINNIENRTSVGQYDNIFNKYRYRILQEGVMSTYVFLLELLYLERLYPHRLEYRTSLDEYYFNDRPHLPVSTDNIEGLDGLEVCEVLLPENGIKMGSRGKTLQSITTKLFYNNPFCHPLYILNEVKRINNTYCENPKPYDNPKPDDCEVETIVCDCYNMFINGVLDFRKAIRRKVSKEKVSKKYVFWSKYAKNIDSSTKHTEGIKTFSDARRQKNLKLYEKAIYSLQDGKKLTKKRIAEYMGKSERQISRYSTDMLEEQIKNYNASLKKTTKAKDKKTVG